jgi:hypothetical protein
MKYVTPKIVLFICYKDYHNLMNKTPVAHYCGGKNSRRIPRSIDEAKSLSFWEVIGTLILITGGILLMSIIWYRLVLARTGSAPFTPPNWMPSFIYPRPVDTELREDPPAQ